MSYTIVSENKKATDTITFVFYKAICSSINNLNCVGYTLPAIPNFSGDHPLDCYKKNAIAKGTLVSYVKLYNRV